MGHLAKRFVVYVLLGLLCVHFGFIFLYASPLKKDRQKINFPVTYYVYPFFHQSWSLFVPAPKQQFALYVRLKKNNEWYQWDNITQQLNARHRRNLLVGGEAEVLLFNNSINYLYHTLKHQRSLYEKELRDTNFQILKHAAKRYLKNDSCDYKVEEFEMLLTCTENGTTIPYYFKNLSLL